MEQEINGNAFIQIDKKTRRGFLSEKNMKHYIANHRPGMQQVDFNKVQQVKTFTTEALFLENEEILHLKSSDVDNGRRDTVLNKAETERLIRTGADFLTKNNHWDGKFTYGYFSCFDKEINFYNMLRHASTLYAMTEAYEMFPDPELAQAIARGLAYLRDAGIKTFSDEEDTFAYVIDGVKEENLEIKLGANAAAILAFTKYTTVFNNNDYLPVAQDLARGILRMQNKNGGFRHVLHYPSLDIKESFRIIYYDGEAAFALMRLFHIDQDKKWLHAVEKAFEHFIEKDYWKHHDHWLSYCTNELTLYKPERKYFEFGLHNVRDKLDFIFYRITTYPTFLELTVAAYKMVERIKESAHADLLDTFNEEKLLATIHKRAEYQRNGYYYPEIAMYFKNPSRIKGSFFIRHHSFRSRIDDVEHYLSGYCQYYQTMI